MIKKAFVLALVLLGCFFPQEVLAEDTTIESVVDMFNISEIDGELQSIGEEYGMEKFSLRDSVLKMVTGEYDFSFSEIVKAVLGIIAGQAKDVIYMMRRIIILILLSAVLETMSSSFSSEGVSKLGQYICSAVLIITIMQSFSYASGTSSKAVDKIADTSNTLQPLYMLIMTAEGKAAKMSAAVPVLYASTSLLNRIVQNIVIPGILFAALITFINSISEKDILMELAELMSFLCKWSVRICAGAFVFIMSVIRIGVPDVAVIAEKTIKTAAGAVPVVGSLMSSAAETAAALTTSTGNAVTAAIMIFIVIMSIMPVIRLAAIMVIYKFTAAVTEPIAPKRIVKCIGRAADYTAILTGVVFTAEIMFITSTAIMLTV